MDRLSLLYNEEEYFTYNYIQTTLSELNRQFEKADLWLRDNEALHFDEIQKMKDIIEDLLTLEKMCYFKFKVTKKD